MGDDKNKLRLRNGVRLERDPFGHLMIATPGPPDGGDRFTLIDRADVADVATFLREAFELEHLGTVTIKVPELTDAKFRAGVRKMIDQALADRAPLFDAPAAVTLGDAPPTEPGWYWFDLPHCDLRCVYVDRESDGNLIVWSGADVIDVARCTGARWSGRIPEPTS